MFDGNTQQVCFRLQEIDIVLTQGAANLTVRFQDVGQLTGGVAHASFACLPTAGTRGWHERPAPRNSGCSEANDNPCPKECAQRHLLKKKQRPYGAAKQFPGFVLHPFPAPASNQADAGQSRAEDRQARGLRYLRCPTAGARAGVAAPRYRRGATVCSDDASAGGIRDVIDRCRKERAWAAAAGELMKTVSCQSGSSDVECQVA